MHKPSSMHIRILYIG